MTQDPFVGSPREGLPHNARPLPPRRPEEDGETATKKPALGEPQAYLLHEGMGNYRVELARDFDVAAHSRLDPLPLFRCPTWPHERGLVYDPETDDGYCRLCGAHVNIEMGSL